MPEQTRFAAYPSAFVYKEVSRDEHAVQHGKTKIQQLIWGDYIRVFDEEDGDWVKVSARGDEGWMRKRDMQTQRLLEVNFVDVGQGDGCFIVTPEDERILVDAGASDNLYRFLCWRFNLRADHNLNLRLPIAATIITHPDEDHYKGFDPVFDQPDFEPLGPGQPPRKPHSFGFRAIYHNGIFERKAERRNAPSLVPTRIGKASYLTEVVTDSTELGAVLSDPQRVKQRGYLRMLQRVYQDKVAPTPERPEVGDIRMLCAEDGFLPGYGADKELSIQVLAPVPEKGPDGKRVLHWFGDTGPTKNGHSVVLKLKYGNVRILLGGDLNALSELYLLQHYTGVDPERATAEEREALIAQARQTFEVDIAKVCHHGSHDFTELFLRAVNALASVVSSGDDEDYCHPRPEALGALGRYGRGERPLIFSTELARSSGKPRKDPRYFRRSLEAQRLTLKAAEATGSEAARSSVLDKIDETHRKLERSVAVYGLINVRTDGHRVLLAQKLERPAPNCRKWDIHCLEPDGSGALRYAPGAAGGKASEPD